MSVKFNMLESDRNAFDNWYRVTKSDNGIIESTVRILLDTDYSFNAHLITPATDLFNQYVNRISGLTRLWWTICGRSAEHQALINLQEIINSKPPVFGQYFPNAVPGALGAYSPESAHAFFMMDFQNIFHKTPPMMTGPERLLIGTISDRIWNSENVQKSENRYIEYKKLMTKYYSGANFHFEEHSLLQTLKDKIGFKDDKKDMGRKQLAARVTSHFVKFVGEVEHVHLAGRQIPETVMHTVELCVNHDGQPVTGIRADMHDAKLPTRKYFWIQTENNPDGPDWTSYLKHRSIDFVIYKFRQKMGYEDVNVGPYAYGNGDKNPIIIRPMVAK